MSQTPTFTFLAATSALVGLIACEGEPPKVPANPTASVSSSAEPTAAETPPEAATPAPAPAPMRRGMPAPCNCMGGREAAGSASAPASEPTPAAPAESQGAADATVHANIVGTVTTTPVRLASSAVVYLEDAPVVPGRGTTARIDNSKMSFIPFITVVATGGRVAFTNSDPFPHNVFSPDNERFNLGMLAQKSTNVHVFKKAGTYTLLCNLHPNMLGYVVVTPSSYFAKADKKGQFTIKDVPPGTYKVTGWAPRMQAVTQTVTVKSGDTAVNFDLHR